VLTSGFPSGISLRYISYIISTKHLKIIFLDRL
jgi:hypothetical protein